MTLPNPPYIGNPIPNQPFHSPETPATFDRLSGTLVPNIQLDPNPSTLGSNGWVRPADWLPMPDISPTEEKFAGLFAVYNTPENFIAVYFEGDYVVDWGDGSVESFTSGETAQHSYDWDSIPESTLTSEGYKQVLVTVTPYPGDHLRVLDLTVRHDSIANNGYDSNAPWLDLAISAPQAQSGASLRFVSDAPGSEGSGWWYSTQRVDIIHAGGMDDFTYALYANPALRYVRIRNSPNANIFDYTFQDCYNLTEVILEDTSTATSVYQMFYRCSSLEKLSLFDTSNVEYFYGMLQGCESLLNVPLFDTSSAVQMLYMLSECKNISTVPAFDLSNGPDISGFFRGCRSLVKVPEIDASSVSSLPKYLTVA